MITIQTVKTKSQLKQFIQFPNRLYMSDPCYVPDLYISQKAYQSKKTNPFFAHSNSNYCVAQKEGKIVGRIGTIYNTVHNEIYNENTGLLGFFDTIDSCDVAEELLNQVNHKNS